MKKQVKSAPKQQLPVRSMPTPMSQGPSQSQPMMKKGGTVKMKKGGKC